MEVQRFFKERCGDVSIGNGQMQVHEIDGLQAFQKLPPEFSELVDFLFECLPLFFVVPIRRWDPDPEYVVNIALVKS